MLQKYDIFKDISRWKVLQLFFIDSDRDNIGLREISRLTGLSTPSVKLHLDKLVKEDILQKGDFRGMPVYWAHQADERFRYLKKINTINKLYSTGLIEYLVNVCQPDVIILFGSASRGEDMKESDIDIYIQSEEKKLALTEYERKLQRKIQLHCYTNFNKLSPELKNNILNGIIIEGYLKIFA